VTAIPFTGCGLRRRAGRRGAEEGAARVYIHTHVNGLALVIVIVIVVVSGGVLSTGGGRAYVRRPRTRRREGTPEWPTDRLTHQSPWLPCHTTDRRRGTRAFSWPEMAMAMVIMNR